MSRGDTFLTSARPNSVDGSVVDVSTQMIFREENTSQEFTHPTLSDDIVIIYYWKPTGFSTGHVSLETSKIYASLWPRQRPEMNSGYTEQGILKQSYQDDVVEEARDSARETGEADDKAEIKGLDVEEINKRFLSFRDNLDSTNKCNSIIRF